VSVYSNTEIKEAVRNGTIVSVPYEPDHVSEASLDFTLGYYFYKQEVRNDEDDNQDDEDNRCNTHCFLLENLGLFCSSYR
jgi:deoxycytidine triphosphate deaminase